MKVSKTDKPEFDQSGQDNPSSSSTSSSDTDNSDSNSTSSSDDEEEEEENKTTNDSDESSSADSSSSSSSENTTSSSSKQLSCGQDAPEKVEPPRPALNAVAHDFALLLPPNRDSISDCASENGFEGFSSPNVKKNRNYFQSFEDKARSERLLNVKVSKLEDTSDSEDSKATFEELNLSTDSDSSSDEGGSTSISQRDKTDLSIPIEPPNIDPCSSGNILPKIETINIDDEDSNTNETTIEKLPLENVPFESEKKQIPEIEVLDIHVKSSPMDTSEKIDISKQTVEELTKAAIGEVVDACNDESSTGKLPNNVIKKIINNEDSLLVEGPSKLSGSGNLSSIKALNKVMAPALCNANKNSNNGKSDEGVAVNLPKISLSAPVSRTSSPLHKRASGNSNKRLSKMPAVNNSRSDDSSAVPKSVDEMDQSSPRDPLAKLLESVHSGPVESGYSPMLIQAEVVMSEESDGAEDNGSFQQKALVNGDDAKNVPSSAEQDVQLAEYLQSFVGGSKASGSLLQFHPPHVEPPQSVANLTQWQLDSVKLPAFTPSQQTPDWIRLTIPPEGYKCHNCGDTFFLQSSVEAHMQRKTVIISLECGPCDSKITFYNRCSLREHLRHHILKGEEVDEDTVEVRSLPLHMTPLMQPYISPVPKAIQAVDEMGIQNSPDRDRGSKMARCYMCEQVFSSVRELMSHMKTDKPFSDRRVECRKCQMILPSICAAKAHILTHPPANASNITVCPECGSVCNNPRDFIHHINTCGHQLRRAGIICSECKVCFFKNVEDFLAHWVKEHCSKSYECVVCCKRFESLVFHSCSAPGQQVLSTFSCVLACPLCDLSVIVNEQDQIHTKVREHIEKYHNKLITRIHYVFKSKFCSNAFRSKDELRAHHDREHRREDFYQIRPCSLRQTVVATQQQYGLSTDTSDQRSVALVTIPVILSADEKREAANLKIPSVSSVQDKGFSTDGPYVADIGTGQQVAIIEGVRVDALTGEVLESSSAVMDVGNKPTSNNNNEFEGPVSPYVCYRCGMTHTERKRHKRHVRGCSGEVRDRVCRVCQNSFKGDDFVRHCEHHMQQGVILCMLCNGAQFESIQKLHGHFEKHAHEQFVYPAVCPFCGIIFSDVPSSLAHLQEKHALAITHGCEMKDLSGIPSAPQMAVTTDSSVTCDKCGRKFQGGRGLSVHALTCGAVNPPISGCNASSNSTTPGTRQCKACLKTITPETLGKHMSAHLQEGLVVCSLCDGMVISSSVDLLEHLESHSTAFSYPYTCIMCQKTSDSPESALRHLKEEHGLGHLPCPECDMSYTFSQQLARHTEIVHRICLYAKRRYICWICRAYDHVKKDTLMNHFTMVHGLERSQVDEKVMIRTRGQGTMPTAQFVPTKNIKKKDSKTDKVSLGVSKSKTSPEKLHSPPLPLSSEKNSPNDSKRNLESSVSSDASILNSKLKVSSPSYSTSSCVDTVESVVKISSPSNVDLSPCKSITLSDSLSNESEMTKEIKSEVLKKGTERNFASESDKASSVSDSGSSKLSSQKIIKVDIKEALSKQQLNVTKVKVKEASVSVDGNSDGINMAPQSAPSTIKRSLSVMSSESETPSEKSESSNIVKKKKIKAHQCTLCSFATNFREKLERHKQKHADGSLTGYICQECGQSFVVQQSLVRHMFFAHKIKWQGTPEKDSDEFESKRSLESSINGEKKIKIESLDFSSSPVVRTPPQDAHLINLPKISANPIKIMKDEPTKLSRVSISKISTQPSLTKSVAPQGMRKLTVVSVTPLNGQSNDAPIKVTGPSERKSNMPVISKQIIINKPPTIQVTKERPTQFIRAPIKISNSSIVSVVSDKINALSSKVSSHPTFQTKNILKSTSTSSSESLPTKNIVVDSSFKSSAESSNQIISLSSNRVIPSISTISKTSAPISLSNKPSLALFTKPPITISSVVNKAISPVSCRPAPSTPISSPGPAISLKEFPCHVCSETFLTESEQYSHMRTHGMAFLQMGRKKRLASSDKTGHPNSETRQDD